MTGGNPHRETKLTGPNGPVKISNEDAASLLNVSAIAAELANMVDGMRGDLQRDSGSNEPPSISNKDAASMMNVSLFSLQIQVFAAHRSAW